MGSASQGNEKSILWLLTLTTLFSAGIIYYNQPLLGEIADGFQVSHMKTGSIPMLTQLGYVLGLLFVTPLGDVLEKRKLIVGLLILGSFALFAGALVPTFSWFSFFALIMGLASVVVQILIPFVAASSPPEKRAQNLGVIVSAALIGILLSRTFSGLIGGQWGWQAVYFAGGSLALVFAGILRWQLPSQESKVQIQYPVLIHSLWLLFQKIPALRSISLVGACMYGSMCAFWTSLAFFLQDQYSWGPAVAGAFGLLGAVGALSAQLAGRLAQRVGPRRVVRACIILMIFSFGVMAVFGSNVYLLVLAVLILDLGAQAATVSNQSELYKLHPEAQTRLNTIYKMLYFLGGSAGSAAAAIAWHHEKWAGVCLVGIIFLACAGLIEMILMPKESKSSDSSAESPG